MQTVRVCEPDLQHQNVCRLFCHQVLQRRARIIDHWFSG